MEVKRKEKEAKTTNDFTSLLLRRTKKLASAQSRCMQRTLDIKRSFISERNQPHN